MPAKPGLFQTAHGGVLFLDEVALLSESLQAKLLTARALGLGRGGIYVRDLERMVAFYRDVMGVWTWMFATTGHCPW